MTTFTDTDSFGTRAGRTLKRAFITLLVLGLAGVVLFLLSQLNARSFSLEIRDGKLVVMKGRMLPTGTEAYRPSDPVVADTYAPIDLEGTTPTQVTGQKYSERDELDRALFEVIEGLAKSRVASDDPKALDKGLYYLRRAEKLSGLSEEQRLSVKAMQAEVAYYLARTRLEEAQKMIEDAMGQLRISAQSQNRHARSANQMISAVEAPAKALEDALRKAVHSLSAPPAEPTTPPAPAPEPAAPPPPTPSTPEGTPPAPAPNP